MSDPVLDLLNKNAISYSISGRDYVIKCLNPEHDDKNPSFRIDRISGAAHCFSCGFKTNIFKYFGVFTNPVPIRIAVLKQKLAELKITPQPETIIRVMMLTRPLTNKIDVPLQDLKPLHKTRKGFTVVEWGGSELNHTIVQ